MLNFFLGVVMCLEIKFLLKVILMLLYYFKRNIVFLFFVKIGYIRVMFKGRENTYYGLFDYFEE